VWAGRLSGAGGYAVELVRSDDLKPESWQHMIDLLDREGQIPIIRLATFKDEQNQWWTAPPPDSDGQDYKSAADRYRRFFDAIDWHSETVLVTVGNEPNRPDEWGGAPNPAAYARFLRDVSESLGRVTSVKVLVLNGALDAYAPSASFGRTYAIDSERFMEGMVAEVPDIFERLDGWASHAYPLGPFGEHPGHQVFKIDDVRPNATPRKQPPPGIVNRGVNGYEWELWKLGQLGVKRELPVYVTESGWRHSTSQVAGARDHDFATVDDARFAELVGLAFDGPASGQAEGWTPWNADPRVKAVGAVRAGRPPRGLGPHQPAAPRSEWAYPGRVPVRGGAGTGLSWLPRPRDCQPCAHSLAQDLATGNPLGARPSWPPRGHQTGAARMAALPGDDVPVRYPADQSWACTRA